MTTTMTQTEARALARHLNTVTGQVHVATTVPAGSWGGTESGWDVDGPATREAERLERHWRRMLSICEKSPAPSDRQCDAEAAAYEALCDYVDEHDLTYTHYDPRGPRDEEEDHA